MFPSLTPLFLSLVLSLTSAVGSLTQGFHAQASIDPKLLSGDYETTDTASFHGQKLTPPPPETTTPSVVLGDNSQSKRIEVDLTNQRVYAYEGDRKVYDFLISSGKWGRTPTGVFRIWGKFRYTKMSGGSQALRTYYYLPNVPYVMFFENDKIAASRGFSLHGTYWHDNFGQPMSHGCINMRTEDAGTLFYWSQPTIGDLKTARATADNPGTTVVIYGEAPSS